MLAYVCTFAAPAANLLFRMGPVAGTFTVVHHTAPHIPFKPAGEWNAAKAQLSGTVHCDYPRVSCVQHQGRVEPGSICKHLCCAVMLFQNLDLLAGSEAACTC